MDPVPRLNPAPSRLDRALPSLLLLMAVIYAVFLWREGSSCAGGADSSGYMNSARLLGEGRWSAPMRPPEGAAVEATGAGAFMPLGFSARSESRRLIPTYPLGLPLHLLVAAKIAGWDRAAILVNLFSAIGGGGVLWLLGRRTGFSPAWSAIAVAWLWFCPLLIFSSVQAMSDSLAMLWGLAVLLCSLRLRDGARWGVACGVALAVAVLVRPTNVLLAIPVLLAAGWNLPGLAWIFAGGLPGAVLLGFYNQHAYGSVLATGYGDVSDAFGPAFLPHNLRHIFLWVPQLLSPLVCLVAVLPFLRKRWTRDGLTLAAWPVLLIGFYSFYFHTGETWWYLRFILPAFPLLILGAISVLREITRCPEVVRYWAPKIVLVLALGWETRFNHTLHPASVAAEQATYRNVTDWARKNIPQAGAVFCMQVSGAFFFYTDLPVVRWDQINPDAVAPLLDALAKRHRAAYAVLYEFETRPALDRLGGEWSKTATVGDATVWERKN